jgi:pyridoxal phosphate enzyme (YggS family)
MSIAENIRSLQIKKEAATLENNRQPESVHLIAVSKGQPVEAILQAYAAGLSDFGENYYQEAKDKISLLKDLPLTWHFLGRLQSNKTADLARIFTWVHSVDRLSIAELLSQSRPADFPPLQICIQVNLDNERSKAGLLKEELFPFVEEILPLKNMKLRGLMAIPEHHDDSKAQYESFNRLALLLEALNQKFSVNLDTLSMGMSDDFTAAIKAGSTMIRIGRTIFGERQA